MEFKKNKPFNNLPLLPPQANIETLPIMRRCISASRALAELKGAGNLIPNQAILINSIPLQEAQFSSEIENVVTTQDALFRAVAEEDGRKADPNTREVLRYRQALRYGYDASLVGKKVTIDLIVELCSILLDRNIALRDQEPIIVEDVNTGSVIFTPPRERAVIVNLLRNLIDFVDNGGEFDPLIRLAIAHYQFETIHPFIDGNGRTGRILNLLFLLQAGLLDIPVLYLSRYIIHNKQAYYQRLRAVTEKGDWEQWVLFMLSAVEETALWTTNRIEAIRALLEATIEQCRIEIPKIYSKELIELIFYHPYCKISFLTEAGIAERQTASQYLQELERIGILSSEKRGREVIYRNPGLLDLLSA